MSQIFTKLKNRNKGETFLLGKLLACQKIHGFTSQKNLSSPIAIMNETLRGSDIKLQHNHFKQTKHSYHIETEIINFVKHKS